MADKDLIIGRAINMTGMIGVSAGIVLFAFGAVAAGSHRLDSRLWWVVVPQATGAPLRFECETEQVAQRFALVFERTTERSGQPR